jgi:hypothetical protein
MTIWCEPVARFVHLNKSDNVRITVSVSRQGLSGF